MVLMKEILEDDEDINSKIFYGLFLLEYWLNIKKSKRSIKDEEIVYLLDCYKYLVLEKNKVVDLNNRIKSLNHFWGVR